MTQHFIRKDKIRTQIETKTNPKYKANYIWNKENIEISLIYPPTLHLKPCEMLKSDIITHQPFIKDNLLKSDIITHQPLNNMTHSLFVWTNFKIKSNITIIQSNIYPPTPARQPPNNS
jgi:hypothetical protein